MRISTIKSDPGYSRDTNYKILYNGYERNFVFTADEEKRYIVCAKLNSLGKMVLDSKTDDVAMETLYGDVYIEKLENDILLVEDQESIDIPVGDSQDFTIDFSDGLTPNIYLSEVKLEHGEPITWNWYKLNR